MKMTALEIIAMSEKIGRAETKHGEQRQTGSFDRRNGNHRFAQQRNSPIRLYRFAF